MNDSQKIYQKIKVKHLPDSRVSIEGEITADFFRDCYQETVEILRQNFEAPGFRKGHVPEQIFMERVNMAHLLEEAAETTLRKAYPEIIRDQKLHPLAPPQISITKLAPNNPMGFQAEIIVRPQVKLGDYKKIAKKSFSLELPVELKEEEVENFIKQIVDMESKIQNRNTPQGTEPPVVELTDELVKQLGPFENVEDFKRKIREDMIAQKKNEGNREKREKFAEEFIKASSLELPKVLVDEEAEAGMRRLLEDLKNANLTLEEYVKKLDKTEEQFRKEKRDQIENQLKLRFLFEDLATLEKLNPPHEEIDAEVSRLKKSHSEASHDQLHAYVELVMRNEAVLKFLESLASLPN